MRIFVVLTLFLPVAVLFSACSDDDDGHGSFKLTVQDKEEIVSDFKARLDITKYVDGKISQVLIFSASTDHSDVSFEVTNWDFQEPPHNAVFPKDYHHEPSTSDRCHVYKFGKECERAWVKYLEEYHEYDSRFAESILTINKCNGRKVSGTFNLELTDTDNETNTRMVSGVFTDVPYKTIHLEILPLDP